VKPGIGDGAVIYANEGLSGALRDNLTPKDRAAPALHFLRAGIEHARRMNDAE
jgi:hypothetical protein